MLNDVEPLLEECSNEIVVSINLQEKSTVVTFIWHVIRLRDLFKIFQFTQVHVPVSSVFKDFWRTGFLPMNFALKQVWSFFLFQFSVLT